MESFNAPRRSSASPYLARGCRYRSKTRCNENANVNAGKEKADNTLTYRPAWTPRPCLQPAWAGEDCALQFLQDLDDLTEVPERDDERKILVVFHNLKGFDGMFILHELYQQQREVANQLTVGAKVLKSTDSLCFLPMPLASFPSTFNLTELKKGFFPHLFNTPDYQQYVGRIPDLEFYDPDGMMAKKKEELTRWHTDQVRRNIPFHFQQEMIDYCKSDVALLKASGPLSIPISWMGTIP